ncbi:IS66 family transposase [Mesorhizobium abyssinicae]|uniref:IS66 family transposase n=1 Tax=Mesorhizobium abyssinicae TaxID=1209958 RepID=UPI00387DC629
MASQPGRDDRCLWKVENAIRGHNPLARMAARQDRSAAIVPDLFSLWDKELPRISGKSKLRADYATSRRAALEHFLIDGRAKSIPISSRAAIRPQTSIRKKSLRWLRSSGRVWATIATTCTR